MTADQPRKRGGKAQQVRYPTEAEIASAEDHAVAEHARILAALEHGGMMPLPKPRRTGT